MEEFSVRVWAVVGPRVDGYEVGGSVVLLLTLLLPQALRPAQEQEGGGQGQRHAQPRQHVRPTVVTPAVDLEHLHNKQKHLSIHTYTHKLYPVKTILFFSQRNIFYTKRAPNRVT